MKLYEFTITAYVDDLDTLEPRLEAKMLVEDSSMVEITRMILPAHLRKVADDIESGKS